MMRGLKNLLAFARGDAEKATVADLTPALPQAEAEVHAAHAAAGAAEAAYRSALLVVDDAKLQGLDAARREAAVRVDRAEALSAALRERMGEAQEREAEAGRISRYEAARRQADDAAAALRQMYPTFAGGLIDLLRGIAQAEIAVADANDDLPRGAERLPGVEARVCNVPGTPRRLASERTVELWCRPGDRLPGNLDQELVKIGEGGRGYIRPPPGSLGRSCAASSPNVATSRPSLGTRPTRSPPASPSLA